MGQVRTLVTQMTMAAGISGQCPGAQERKGPKKGRERKRKEEEEKEKKRKEKQRKEKREKERKTKKRKERKERFFLQNTQTSPQPIYPVSLILVDGKFDSTEDPISK